MLLAVGGMAMARMLFVNCSRVEVCGFMGVKFTFGIVGVCSLDWLGGEVLLEILGENRRVDGYLKQAWPRSVFSLMTSPAIQVPGDVMRMVFIPDGSLTGTIRDVKEAVNALCHDWTRNHVLVEETIRVKVSDVPRSGTFDCAAKSS